MDLQAHVPAGHQPLLAVLHDSPSPAHAPLLCARTWTSRPTFQQGTDHSSLSCMTLLLPLTLPCSAARLPRHCPHRLSAAPGSAACLPCRRPHCPSTALALHQGSRAGSTLHGLHMFTLPHSAACPPCRRPHCLSTAPALHQGSRAGSTQHGQGRVYPGTDAACTGLLAPLRACLAATRTALAPHTN